jgi:PAS domain S-box-containing protein
MRADETIQKILLGDALEGIAVAVFVKDEYGRHAAANQAAVDLTGYSRDEILGLTAEELSGRDAIDLDQRLVDFRKNGHLPGRGPLRRKDGTIIEIDYAWMETTAGGLPFYLFFVVPAGTPMFAG